jgi:hypothetical protein
LHASKPLDFIDVLLFASVSCSLLARQYAQAYQLVQSCEADMKLTDDESWCFQVSSIRIPCSNALIVIVLR